MFHYERLIHWKNLNEKHKKLIEFTKLLAPKSYEILSKTDGFDAVHSAGIKPTRQLVKGNFNLKPGILQEAPKMIRANHLYRWQESLNV